METGPTISTSCEEIGEIRETGNDVEWTLKDIFQYTMEDECYRSPSFLVSGSKWFFQIYPNGNKDENCVGWISLYLRGEFESTAMVGANFVFGVKKADGTIEKITRDFTCVFDNDTCGLGRPKFLERENLLKRKVELAPSDELTVTCSLFVNKSFDSAERLNTLSENLLDMFNNKKGCDMTLKVGKEEFAVHKFILEARSPVFASMIDAEFKKKKLLDAIVILNCNPEPFKQFLTYLYSGKIENLSSNVLELHKIATKYKINELKSACLLSMMSSLSLENMCDAAVLAYKFNETVMKMKVNRFFKNNFNDVVHSEKWEALMKDNYTVANDLLKNMSPKPKSDN